MSAWNDFVTASLLGTEKGGDIPPVPTALENALGSSAGLEREGQFLTRAGALSWWRQAGWKGMKGETTPLPCAPPETDPLINPASIAHLLAMLGGHCADVLPEWLGEVARRHRRLPPEWLPALLDRARQNRAARPLLLAAGGERLQWLADQNPEWNFAADDSPEHWETGKIAQRLTILHRWRLTDPTRGREKLAEMWSTEPAEARREMLELLATGLSGDDAPFLERALDDRSKEVRRIAVHLLARLPDTPFAERMTIRADVLLAFKLGGLLKRASFDVTLPGEPDPAALRDGLDPKILEAPRTMGGEKTAVLAHTLAAVPLRHWTDLYQQTPEALVKTAGRHGEFAAALITGWGMAAIRQRDVAWVKALLEWPFTRNTHLNLVRNDELFGVLPVMEVISRLRDAVRAEPLKLDVQSFNATSWPGYFMLLAGLPEYLPEDLSRLVLGQFRELAIGAPGVFAYHLRGIVEAVALKTPPALLSEVAEGWPMENPLVAPLLERLIFRRDALAALAQP